MLRTGQLAKSADKRKVKVAGGQMAAEGSLEYLDFEKFDIFLLTFQ